MIRGYTFKQWGKDPKALPPEIMNCIPVRYNDQGQYFIDPWQGIPVEGFGQILKSMLHHPNIDTHLNTDFFSIQDLIPKDCQIIYSGPIDRFFHYQHGRLEWRSLSFERKTIDTPDFQGIAVMNYAESSVPYTRIHEFKYLTVEQPVSPNRTLISIGYPKDCTPGDEPFYPVNTPDNQKIYQQYVEAGRYIGQVIFGGRLGSYSYLDIWIASLRARLISTNTLLCENSEFFRRPYPIINEQVAISRFKNSNCSRLRYGRFGRVFASGLRYNLSYSDIIVPGCHSGLK